MNKFLSLLGLSRRAGKLSPGFDASIEAIKKKAAHLIVVSFEMSEKTKKNIAFDAEKMNVPVLETPHTIEELSKAIGKKAGVMAITDKDFAKGIVKAADNQG